MFCSDTKIIEDFFKGTMSEYLKSGHYMVRVSSHSVISHGVCMSWVLFVKHVDLLPSSLLANAPFVPSYTSV